MRFSLKLALAAMAYVALAAAAIGAKNASLADFVWTLSVLAFCYAVVVTFFGLGRQRPVALGFAVLWAANVVCLELEPDRVPSSRLLHLIGFSVSHSGTILVPADPGAYGGGMPTLRTAIELAPVVQAANAAGTMAAGLIGCGLGALAYRRGGREQGTNGQGVTEQ